jgi:hypothetical protein
MNKLKHWFEYKFLTGHISFDLPFGWHMTIYGRNAMHWGVSFHTKKWGYICFRLPLPCFGKFYPLYFYLSPNATPWAATLLIGGGKENKKDRMLSGLRKYYLGHNFHCEGDNYKKLRLINTFYPDINNYREEN